MAGQDKGQPPSPRTTEIPIFHVALSSSSLYSLARDARFRSYLPKDGKVTSVHHKLRYTLILVAGLGGPLESRATSHPQEPSKFQYLRWPFRLIGCPHSLGMPDSGQCTGALILSILRHFYYRTPWYSYIPYTRFTVPFHRPNPNCQGYNECTLDCSLCIPVENIKRRHPIACSLAQRSVLFFK
jgi:hypothetical protein